MEEIHAKISLYNYKNGLKEVRRIGLHAATDAGNWSSTCATINGLFSMSDTLLTYEDPEDDRISLGSQLEWEECLRLGPYTTSNPLRLHLKKKYGKDKECKTMDAPSPVVETIDAYMADGDALPQDLDRLKGPIVLFLPCTILHSLTEIVPAIINRNLQNFPSAPLPDWLKQAVQIKSTTCGEIDFDVTIEGLPRDIHVIVFWV